MVPKTETSGDDASEEWSTPVNWEEDPVIKAKRRRRSITKTVTTATARKHDMN